MTLAQVVDGVTDLDSALFNPIIDQLNGIPDGDALTNRVAAKVLAADFGVVGNGTTDSTTYLQDAIDYAQTLVSGSTGAPIVELPPGSVVITDEIDKKSAGLVGASTANNGCRIVWNGANGGTAITQGSQSGGSSFGVIANINFRQGTGNPACWIDLSGQTVDVFYQLNHLQFLGGDIQIIVGQWTNLHWEHLRFDNWHNYAIKLTPPSSQNLSSFVIDKFTADHHPTSGVMGSGFLHLDNSAGATNLGVAVLRNGRIETNALMQSPNAIVVVSDGGGARVTGWRLQDMTIAGAANCHVGSLLYRDSVSSTGSERYIFENMACSGVTAFLDGAWLSSFPSPAGTPGNIGYMCSGQWNGAPLRIGAHTLWVNDSDDKLYIKDGTPSSATDGTVVGTQS